MIFPHYNYQNYHNDNKESWPLQPPTIENWCQMVNDASKYCLNLKNINEFIGIVSPSALPSFHPYWKNQVRIDTFNTLIKDSRKLRELLIKRDYRLLQREYNLEMSVEKAELRLLSNLNKIIKLRKLII